MSAAIKRLSTIIRPSSNSSPPSSPPKAPSTDPIDAPAPAAPVEAAATPTETAPAETAAPTTETANGNGTTADAVKDAVTSAAPEDGATAVPATTDEAKDATEGEKDKEAASTSVKSKKDKEGKPASHRRDPRDIGRSTIRRFSTILRSQGKDAHKEPAPPVPAQPESTPPAEGETPAAPAEPEAAAAATEAPTEDATPKENGAEEAAPADKDKDAKSATKPGKTSTSPSATNDKSNATKVNKRGSSFFTAAREGLQRTAKDVQTRARGQPGAPKPKPAAKVQAVVVPKIVKKGAAKGKRVVVITGASKGVGLEFVKQFASQPNTFVIALSRTADKSVALKPIVSASAKEGHNVRAIKLDVGSTRSIHNVVKDIVELTDGRIDLLINAAGSRGDPALKVWDLKGNELEEELRTNLVGPITFTNALIPYLKPMPPKEEKKEEKAEEKEEKKEEKAEAKEEAEEKKEGASEATGAKAEKLEAKEEKLDAKDPALTVTTIEPGVEGPSATAAGEEITTLVPEAKVEETAAAPAEPAPVEGEAAEPAVEAAPAEELAAPVEVPSVLPEQPFVLFLTPADPIQNIAGTVPTGSSFAPSPRTLFSLSRAALQVAIAKYAIGMGGKGVGIVGVERHGYNDPHSGVSDEQAAADVIKLLPELHVRDNGKLLKTTA